MPSEAPRRPRESVSQSTDDASTRLTPSDIDSDDGLPLVEDKGAYELHPLSGAPEDNPSRDSYDDEEGPRFTSRASVQSYELYTPDEDKAVLKKLDRKLVGFMALLYCLSFLDRSSKPHALVEDCMLQTHIVVCRAWTLQVYMSAANPCSDIGNARIAGLEDDLKLTSNQYEWLLWAFYITYIVFEWMTLMLAIPISIRESFIR